MIAREFGEASRCDFDLVVVGGGIYGASLLHEAARLGLAACLFEAQDFGGGTSWNSLRIVHGGLRYLQTLDLRRFFQSVAARRSIAKQFPALVRPLQCLMPLYARGLKRSSVMRMALRANDLLSAGRNEGLEDRVRLPSGRILGVAETRRAFPAVRTEGLEGAALWSDYSMVSSERIIMELLRDACRLGAMAFNYTPVLRILENAHLARGVEIRDEQTGANHEIGARAVVNCAGPWACGLVRGKGGDVARLFRPSLAFNVLLDVTLEADCALAVAPHGAGVPVLFVVPQPDGLLAGTMHVARPAGTTEASPTQAELEGFLVLLNAAIPGIDAGVHNVRRVFAGLLPARAVGSADLAHREVVLDHGKAGGVGRLYSVSGVKFTTASDVSRQVLVMAGLARHSRAEIGAVPLSPATATMTDARSLWSADAATAAGTLRAAIAEESVQTLDDLVLRRTNWAATEMNLDSVRDRAAQLLDGVFREHR